MLRLKVILVFAVSLILLAAVAFFSFNSAISSAIEEDTDDALRRAATVAELERSRARATLVAKANFVGTAPDLYEAIVADYSKKANPEPEGEPIEVSPEVARHERHLKVHERLNRYKIEFEQYYKSGPGKDARQLDIPLQWQKPSTPDLFFAVDKEGVGLAAIGKDLLKWYNSDVSKDQLLISEVLTKKQVRTGVIEWSFDGDEDKGLYLVAIAPITLNREQAPVGAVVVGSRISDGVAQDVKAMMAGTYEQGLEDVEADRVSASAPEIAYFHGATIVGSTFDSDRQKRIASAVFEEQKMLDKEGVEASAKIEIDEDQLLVRLRKIPGLSTKDAPHGIITTANLTAAQKPLKDPGTNVLFATVVILLLGTVAILVFIQLFFRPIEKIESGIQEVAAGNKEHVFEYRGSNKMAQGLAHQLNLMSAFLQGKSLSDEDGGGNWNDMGGDPGAGSGGPAKVQGVNMADLMGKKKDPEA